jgi:hypothetical protein
MNSFLMDQAVRATLLLIAAYLSAFAMRRASASARRLVWIAAAACLLAMPLLSLLAADWRRPGCRRARHRRDEGQPRSDLMALSAHAIERSTGGSDNDDHGGFPIDTVTPPLRIECRAASITCSL